MKRQIHLYLPYYLSDDFERQKELDRCLQKNTEVGAIDRIFLLIDDGHQPPITSDKITQIHTEGRPNYAQWVEFTQKNSQDAISVLANSDIYFDEGIVGMEKVLAASPHAFVALSRYEVVGDEISMHPNPHWSQDAWAIDGRVSLPDALRLKLSIPLGVPRCDNKVAYIFSLHGYDIFNPCQFVRSYHLHESRLRAYDQHVDKRILGGTAWVYASEAIDTPSRMVFDVWTLKPEPVERIKVNDTIIVKEKQGLGRPRKEADRLIVAYDHNWQFPAITEQHAYEKLVQDTHLRHGDESVRYLAFPWATLIDNLLHNKKNPERTAFFKQKLLSLKPQLQGARTVVTVCQHIHMLRFQSIFHEMGVTDIFWSHAVKGLPGLPDHPEIALHPFPLYPVQAEGHWNAPPKRKKHLYSFVGAKANQYYLTEARNIIIDDLSKTKTGFIVGNETWHYNKVVYDFQVRGLVDKPDALVDNSASEQFRQLLLESVFSLCPSGTGPNSIRLWESIGLGSIPVIIADTLALPGDPALWEQAAVFCAEDRASIMALPARLAKLHSDPEALKTKRHAMAQLWELYGIDSFVYDVRALLLRKSQENRLSAPALSPPAIHSTPADASHFANWTSLMCDILVYPEKAASRLQDSRREIETLVAQASAEQKDIFVRALQLRNIDHIWEKA
ncbi:exostosin family protein [Pseudotabrizicola sp. 4114]|uniref:exostosin domain-containing protein n=1 Tax=Pseudotabrizicola sp. 4114 TaxID=2817731 RepID=UPI00285CCB4B|nr:hypothetical protein [Pseudorhodobacter sp. 4114]